MKSEDYTRSPNTVKDVLLIQIKSAQRDTNLRAGTLQPDRTF